jgi:Zn finger protein HypA/HybF involved in hydrogenase expression
MHEYGLMQEVVALVLQKLQEGVCPETNNLEVILKVGGFAVHSAAATRQAYEALTRGTPLAGSQLNLVVEPVTLNCPGCGYHEALGEGQADPHDPMPLAECPRCGQVAPVHGGRGVESLELKCD